MINNSIYCRSNRLEASVRVLRESWNVIAVVHTIISVRVKVSSVAAMDELALAGNIGGVGVLVIDTEKEWVQSWVP